MKDTEDYMSEEDYEDIFADRITQMNMLHQMDGYEYDIDFAYGGARLVKRNIKTGGEADLSVRFYYDEDGTADYDAFMELLNTILAVMRNCFGLTYK